MVIYKIENLQNGKVYIGQTVRDLQVRIGEHIRKDTTIMGKAFKKYGIEQFSISEIDEAKTIEELNEKEKYWIDYYKCVTPTGYNQCIGGENTLGYSHSEKSKKKMNASKSKLFTGDGNPFYGKQHSDESKAKMSEKRKGMAHLSAEQVQNLRKSHHTVKVLNVDTSEVFDSVKEAGEKYNLKPTHITKVCRGRQKTTGGYHWEYV